MLKASRRSAVPMTLLIIGLLLSFAAGCSDDDGGGTVNPTVSEFEIVSDAANAFLSSGASATMSSSALYTTLNDGITSNDPFILDIRSATDFAAGHIPGAVNVPYRDVAKTANSGVYPASQQIVVVCYTGHTASQVTAWLGSMGYDATALKFGMSSWTVDPTYNPSVATVRPYDVSQDCGDYPVSTAATTPGSYAAPALDNTSSTSETEIVRAAADTWLAKGTSGVTTASAVYTNLNDGNTANDPLILDVRGASDYAAGHVTGAINVPFREIATTANLAKLDPTKSIVVICYTGHTASQTTMLLNMMGYDAQTMKYGMTSWTVDPTKNPSITTIKYYDESTDCGDYPCETGS